MKLTPADIPKMGRALMPFVNTLLLAQTFAEVERERVRPIYAEALDYLDIRDARTGERITDPDKAWHMSDADSAVYYAECDKRIHEVEEWRAVPKGQCPALIAESIERKAERLMFEESAKWFPEFHPDRLYLHPGISKKARDLLIGLTVNAPGYVPPKLVAA